MEKNINWWKNALVYQIYPLSFKDSNNDGIGDINGIREKLPYLKEYGVDVIWLSPVYDSPMDDNGYDISDYYNVNKLFGTKNDLFKLINEVHQHGMKIIMDLVVNHTSDEHIWFKAALQDKKSKYRDYYIWKKEPTPDIKSVFSNSAWEYDEKSGEYYFHLFSKKQPDLNWQNKNLRYEIYDMINYWLSNGIDGFRMDVIDLIGKDIDSSALSNGPHLKEYLREMYDNCFKNKDIMTVGEMNGISIEDAKDITSDKSLGMNMTFQFSHLAIDELPNKGKWALKKYNPNDLKKIFIRNNALFSQSGWNSLFLSNHDQPRMVSRFGSETLRSESSKMLFTMLYLQKGTPYVYMGEELGMTGIKFNDISLYKDIETINYYNEAKSKNIDEATILESIHSKGRDNSRTPFQWNNDKYSGFSTTTPWLSVNPNYKSINLAKQLDDPNSIYNYTKSLFQIRKKYDVFTNGSFEPLFTNLKNSFIYLREDKSTSVLVVNNMGLESIMLDLSKYKDYKCILQNTVIKLESQTTLKSFASGIFIKENIKQ